MSTSEGARRLSVSRDTPVEELVPAREVLAGAEANIGGNRTESGFVLTGIVILGQR